LKIEREEIYITHNAAGKEEGFYSLSCEESWDSTIAEWVNFFYVLLKLLLSLPVRRGLRTCEYLFPDIIPTNISTCKERVKSM
jgi:hypothetical protein